jgi:uncharacterized SAM-binding protein YcdF (DUF218 family)
MSEGRSMDRGQQMQKPIHNFNNLRYIFIGLGILGLTVLILFREQLLQSLGDHLIIEDTLYPADVIHVIAGEDFRTDHAIELYKQGYGRILFFTGGWCETYKGNHGEHAQQRSLAQGVQLEAIAFDDSEVDSTYSEAERLKAWIAESINPIHTVIIVSDPFHMRRARWTYRKVLGNEITVLMSPVPFEKTPYQRVWWTDPESWRYVRDEYIKMIYYLIRYSFVS